MPEAEIDGKNPEIAGTSVFYIYLRKKACHPERGPIKYLILLALPTNTPLLIRVQVSLVPIICVIMFSSTLFRNALQATYPHLLEVLDNTDICDKDLDQYMHFMGKLRIQKFEECQVDGNITKGRPIICLDL